MSKQKAIYQCLFTQCKLFLWQNKVYLNVTGPKWLQSRHEQVLLAARRYDVSRSRKTRCSLADTLQCNIWRMAQTPHMMTHSLHGGDNHGNFNGFAALSKQIGTPIQEKKDLDYVQEHQVLNYFRKKLAYYLHDYRTHWFARLRLPVPNGKHDQLCESQV